ncbi:hypothetical protein LCGC14_2472950, partial [marine sediment metagenome]
VPYIEMTLGLLAQIGVESSFEDNIIKVQPKSAVTPTVLTVESDWSSASYFYSIMALSTIGSEIKLSAYKNNSLQGDSVLSDMYRNFGVETRFFENHILLNKTTDCQLESVDLDLSNAPDIAQTIAVTCFGLGIGCQLTGLHTLKIKETDRLEALYAELTKLNADISVTDKSLQLKPSTHIREEVAIDTYNDHRMAMAFAPLALKTSLFINDAEVVSKSYPDFWKDLETIHFHVKEM